jgi:hypothetical protein
MPMVARLRSLSFRHALSSAVRRGHRRVPARLRRWPAGPGHSREPGRAIRAEKRTGPPHPGVPVRDFPRWRTIAL